MVKAQLISCANKAKQIFQKSKLENSDFLLITETWQADSDEDKARVATNPLDNGENKLLQENRQTKQGGGIALLHKDQYQVTTILGTPKLAVNSTRILD